MSKRISTSKRLSAGYERRLKSAESTERETLSVEQLVKMLGRNRVAIYDDLRAGRIPCRRLGRRFIISRKAVNRWLEGSDLQPAA